MTTIRTIEERDVEAVATLYRDVYGDDYPFREFYDTEWIKRGVFNDEIHWLVAEGEGGRLLGSTAVMLCAGDADDQVAEIGRLVVHPDARGQNLGTRLVGAITAVAEELSDFAFAECRTAHLGSQIIFEREGYHTVGIEPLAYRLDDYETVVYVCRLSETARRLRRSHPRVIPEAFELAAHALRACHFDVDVTAWSHAEPYPEWRDHSSLSLEEMDSRTLYRQIRLSRDCFVNPEVFGAFRLEHGYLKLKKHAGRHLVLRRGDVILGGLGYTFDEVERKVEMFEMVAVDDLSRGTLLDRGIRHIEGSHDPRYLGIDVNAFSPRMQRSLYLLGFAPVTYAPSMVYLMGERLDVLKMVKLRQLPDLRGWRLLPSMVRAASLAEENILETTRGIQIDATARRVRIFEGLTDVQVGEVAALCHEHQVEPAEILFREGSDEQALFVVLEGTVDIVREGHDGPIISVRQGEIFGEMGLLEELPRSAGAVCRDKARLLVLRPEDFDQLSRTDPAAAVVVVRNIARILSQRLREMDEAGVIEQGRVTLGSA